MAKTSEFSTFELKTDYDQSTCFNCCWREKNLVCINKDEKIMQFYKYQPTTVMPLCYLCSDCYKNGMHTIARRERLNTSDSAVSSSFLKIAHKLGPKSSKIKSPLKYKPGPKSFKMKSLLTQRPEPKTYEMQLQSSQTPGRRSSQVTSPLPNKTGPKGYKLNMMLNRPMPKSKKQSLLCQLNEINNNGKTGDNVNKLCIMLNRPMLKSKKEDILHQYNKISFDSQIVDNMNRKDKLFPSIDLSTRNYIESEDSVMMSEELYTPNQESNVRSSDVFDSTVHEISDIFTEPDEEIVSETDDESDSETDLLEDTFAFIPAEVFDETEIPVGVIAGADVPEETVAEKRSPEGISTERKIPDKIIAETYVREEIVSAAPTPYQNGPEWEPADYEPISTLAPLRVNRIIPDSELMYRRYAGG